MPPLSADDIHRLARLAKLSIASDQVADLQARLEAVLHHAENLATLDLEGVEPMSHVEGDVNRLASDELGPHLDHDASLGLAPDRYTDYFKVPKVLGEGGGA
ncbi:MAG: Asp-tRNA(Asn)/Glu-tRNA(Gln) amidotransferase subunit GatC [Phycisphaeraceae bacterium]|nr:Asp-tRNA(Asn)/Glu-tRNA(Gln) amidotransferase subunit GatC [Phycisphaeraceae bacterium]MCW5763667.1 Asp-tRNA(Asn)/Glu-tRNA(Gln) amidotransferase subunit GatC [Phycisphaeraceae bacterium]